MPDESFLEVNDHLQSKRWIIITMPAIGILLDQLASLNNPVRTPLKVWLQPGGFILYGKFLLVHLYIFELLTTILIWLFLSRVPVLVSGLNKVKLTTRSILLYNLKMLPAILLAIIIIAPLSNGLKYLLLKYPNYQWASYYPQWFMTTKMYFNYLLPVLVVSYLMLSINLLLAFRNRLHDQKARGSEVYLKQLKATNKSGTTVIGVQHVFWFEVQDKIYHAYTPKPCQINMKLTELEAKLDPEVFFRINRSQIINLLRFDAYSYWEHDKYILKLKGVDEEFIVTRTKILVLKGLLKIE